MPDIYLFNKDISSQAKYEENKEFIKESNNDNKDSKDSSLLKIRV